MDAKELLTTRRSVRRYTDREIPEETLQEIFSEAMMAPSWKNTQTAGYIVVRSDAMKEKVRGALPSYNVSSSRNASVIVVMTTRHARSGFERDGSYSTKLEDRWEYFDAGIACQTLCLAAWSHGVSSCIMGIYDYDALKEILGIGDEYRITAVIPMGYAEVTPAAPKRKTVEEKVSYV